MTTTVTLAVAQTLSENGRIDDNLARASRAAESAAAQGAELVLFPELMPTGYALNAAIWDAAEPRHGKTVHWLAAGYPGRVILALAQALAIPGAARSGPSVEQIEQWGADYYAASAERARAALAISGSPAAEAGSPGF